jgi:pantothenate kinase-related protein Tda10
MHMSVVDIMLLSVQQNYVRTFYCARRSKRPQHICIILRGLPGSGKSTVAKRIREVEVEHGGEPPRLHALDDYFVTVGLPVLLCSASLPLSWGCCMSCLCLGGGTKLWC